jgi:EAL domain-containing protein (putative c-di-GMP-specific phosphodiesterase class I)
MYQAKGSAGRRVGVFDARLEAAQRRETALEAALPAAIAGGDLTVAYQPIVDLAGGRTVGCEALARWTHEGEAVPPADFIGIAERSGHVHAVGRCVLATVLRDLPRLDAGVEYVTINASPAELTDPAFARRVADALAATGTAPDRLAFEVTEQVLLDTAAEGTLRALCELGVGLLLDDFGTGYASLSYLRRIPLHGIKIDRSFVARVDSDAGDRAIVGAVVDLTRRLGLVSIAEGVERPEQAEILRELGCVRAQGYRYGRPAAL